MKRYLFFSVLLLNSFHFTQAQDVLHQMSKKRIKTNQVGMLTLGTWAVGNMTWGAIQFNGDSGNKHFHRMNLYWNVANFGIATFGYLSARKESIEGLTGKELLEKQCQMEKVLLFNGGLDIAYMLSGAYLMERSKNLQAVDNRSRMKGFGKSVLLQGGFLLAFDTVLYLKHVSNRKHYGKYQLEPAVGQNGVGLRIQF